MTTTQTLTDSQYDLVDRIELALEANPDTWFTPSALARKVKATTHEVGPLLRWMKKNQYVVTAGNGAWEKYIARRDGRGNYR